MLKKIVITGPESTGKTELTIKLAQHYNTTYVPEYAREYIENLNRKYTYDDVETIAKKQINLANHLSNKESTILFLDTYLIITKVWFKWVYNKCPGWLLKSIEEMKIDLFILCNIDLPWIDDPVRENGGENRIRLFKEYKKELDTYGFNYKIVSGFGEERFRNALQYINEIITQ